MGHGTGRRVGLAPGFSVQLILLGCLFFYDAVATTPPRPTTPRTTTPPTTVPHHDGCFFMGEWRPNGAVLESHPNNCYGTQCLDGSIMTWDAECFLNPKTCHGKEGPMDEECCIPCYTSPTTTPKTTTPAVPKDDCLYNGTLYRNYDTFDLSEDGCTGKECHYGNVRVWSYSCAAVDNCNGTVRKPKGHCCDVCMPPEGGCYVEGQIYKYNEIYDVSDPCHPCKCFEDGTTDCAMIKCAVADCENPYREEGVCCYTCGSTAILASTILTLLAAATMEILSAP